MNAEHTVSHECLLFCLAAWLINRKSALTIFKLDIALSFFNESISAAKLVITSVDEKIM